MDEWVKRKTFTRRTKGWVLCETKSQCWFFSDDFTIIFSCSLGHNHGLGANSIIGYRHLGANGICSGFTEAKYNRYVLVFNSDHAYCSIMKWQLIMLLISIKIREGIIQRCRRASVIAKRCDDFTSWSFYNMSYPLTTATQEQNGYPVNRVKKCSSVSLGALLSAACPCMIPIYSVVLF